MLRPHILGVRNRGKKKRAYNAAFRTRDDTCQEMRN